MKTNTCGRGLSTNLVPRVFILPVTWSKIETGTGIKKRNPVNEVS